MAFGAKGGMRDGKTVKCPKWVTGNGAGSMKIDIVKVLESAGVDDFHIDYCESTVYVVDGLRKLGDYLGKPWNYAPRVEWKGWTIVETRPRDISMGLGGDENGQTNG